MSENRMRLTFESIADNVESDKSSKPGQKQPKNAVESALYTIFSQSS